MVNPSQQTGVSTDAVRAKREMTIFVLHLEKKVTSLRIEKVQQITGSKQNAANMSLSLADDHILNGRNAKEHDRDLIKMLESFKERGLTLNAEKYTFWMTKIVFMGRLFTRH